MKRRLRRRLARAALGVAAGGALTALLAGSASAQRPGQQPPARGQTPRRGETIEIRGQVPTPQVVTVRPREAPAYTRRVLVPTFLDRSFWPSILPPLQLVSPASATRADSASRGMADSASRAQPATPPRTPPGTPPAPLRR